MLYLLKPFTRRRAGYFSPALCRCKFNVALLRLRLRSLPQTKIPHRFGRVKDFRWYDGENLITGIPGAVCNQADKLAILQLTIDSKRLTAPVFSLRWNALL